MKSSASVGRVFLVGAGPGDPGLLTLCAAECLRLADVVIYDQLVNPRTLDHAEPTAERICVGDLPGPHAERHPQVHRLLLEHARQGKIVVRLKGGDPGIFGRGGEEAEILKEAGIPYEIIPGVSAALAAGACAGIPLTHRNQSSAVAFVTGHECPGKSESMLDWAALARFPGTLVIYMGIARLPAITRTLIENGKPPDTPAAVVQRASTNQQQTVVADLRTIASEAKKAGLSAPAVAIIGSVVNLRQQIQWFEKRPLFGKSILVTRPYHQSESMVRRLESLGATVHVCPVIRIGPPPDEKAVDGVLERITDFQWLVFTSSNGVEAFFRRLLVPGRDLRALGSLRLAAIGPATAAALAAYHLHADVVPEQYRSEDLVKSLLKQVRGQRVLLARADRGRELLFDELSRVAQVEQIAVYSQDDSSWATPETLDLIRNGRLDYVTLTSSNIARAFVQPLDAECRRRLAAGIGIVTISPVTSVTVKELGLKVAVEAKIHTTDGMIDALL